MGRRVAAFLIDAVVLWAVTFIPFFLVAQRGARDTSLDGSTINFNIDDERWYLEGGDASLFSFAAVAVWLLYLGVLPGLTGWTLGKRVTGIRVVDGAGGVPGLGRGLARGAFWIVDGFPYVIPGLVGFIVALSTQRRQRVGDQVAGTFVVRAGTVPEAEERFLAPGAAPASAPAGWYADPQGEQRLRYWDGHNWTAHTAE